MKPQPPDILTPGFSACFFLDEGGEAHESFSEGPEDEHRSAVGDLGGGENACDTRTPDAGRHRRGSDRELPEGAAEGGAGVKAKVVREPGIYLRGSVWWIRYRGPRPDGSWDLIRESSGSGDCRVAAKLRNDRVREAR